MKTICPNCHAPVLVDEARLGRDGPTRVRCPACAHVFEVSQPEAEPYPTSRGHAAAVIASALGPAAASPEPEDPPSLGFGSGVSEARGAPSTAPPPVVSMTSNLTEEWGPGPGFEESSGVLDGDFEVSLSVPPPNFEDLRGDPSAGPGAIFEQLERVTPDLESGSEPPPFEPFDIGASGPGEGSPSVSAPMFFDAGSAGAFPDAGPSPNGDFERGLHGSQQALGREPSLIDEAWVSGSAESPFARIELTRLPVERGPTTHQESEGSSRRAAGARWPTWLGLAVGLVASALFVPGWAPEPLDQVAPAVARFLHPASRPRLPNAITDIRSEGAVAFPYPVAERTVVVVRGEANNVGPSAHSGVRATVLMLDGDRELARASAPVGAIPDPVALADWVKGDTQTAPATEAVLMPGERLPFLVVFPNVAKQAYESRFRVEFQSRAAPSGDDEPGDSS